MGRSYEYSPGLSNGKLAIFRGEIPVLKAHGSYKLTQADVVRICRLLNDNNLFDHYYKFDRKSQEEIDSFIEDVMPAKD